MHFRAPRFALLAAIAALAAPAVQAQTSLDNKELMTSAVAVPEIVSLTFNNGTAATQALLEFDLYGNGSLDGDNGFIDIFKLVANNSTVLTGTFNMSGGGSSHLIDNPNNAIFNTITFTPTTAPAGVCNTSSLNHCGGVTHISMLINVNANAANSLVFSYSSPTSFNGTTRAGLQGFGDEGWYVGALSVTAVPEPETYAMMLAGLGLMGGMVRRRRRMS